MAEEKLPRGYWSNLLDHEDRRVLEQLYIAQAVPTDQLLRVKGLLSRMHNTFVAATGRSDLKPHTLHRYMVNRRKKGKWPRLGSRATRFDSPNEILTPAQVLALRDVYMEFDECSDEYMFSSAMRTEIARAFAERTGQSVPGSLLVAVIMAKRKRGEWVRIRETFCDIREVG